MEKFIMNGHIKEKQMEKSGRKRTVPIISDALTDFKCQQRKRVSSAGLEGFLETLLSRFYSGADMNRIQ